ncbi:hypothetical protein V3N99_16600 [Dermatophilaceae bacterium Soc4.6]
MPEDWDGVYKRLFRDFPREALRILCDIDATGAEVTPAPTEFTMKLRADGVFQVRPPDGAPFVVHVEVQRSPADDFELRLVRHWLAITTEHGEPPRQVVILPLGGPYTGQYEAGGLTLTYDVLDVTTLDQTVLRGSPLAPLALGSRASPTLVDAVVAQIAAVTDDPDARATLVDLAMLGADDLLAALITDSIRRNDMSDVLERTAEGRALLARGEARGEARGYTAGEAAGLRVLLVEKFGESADLDALSQGLAAEGFAAGLRRIQGATSLADVLA